MSEEVSTDVAVLEILSKIINVPADDLRDIPVLTAHKWDSLTSLETLTELENRFHLKFDLRSYHAARTVDDIVSLVTSAKERMAD
jgi:acyl carrier protein